MPDFRQLLSWRAPPCSPPRPRAAQDQKNPPARAPRPHRAPAHDEQQRVPHPDEPPPSPPWPAILTRRTRARWAEDVAPNVAPQPDRSNGVVTTPARRRRARQTTTAATAALPPLNNTTIPMAGGGSLHTPKANRYNPCKTLSWIHIAGEHDGPGGSAAYQTATCELAATATITAVTEIQRLGTTPSRSPTAPRRCDWLRHDPRPATASKRNPPSHRMDSGASPGRGALLQ